MSRPLSRRSLLAAALVAAATPLRARQPSVNDQVRLAVIGLGVRGKQLIANLPPAFRVEAICDCDSARTAAALAPSGIWAEPLAAFAARDAARCRTYQDYRRLLDVERLDAVIIATPDHHHFPAAHRALAAGLDLYLEKPITVCLAEGRKLIDLARSMNRVIQAGSQQRTMEVNRFACDFLRSGGLGRIHRVELANLPGPLAMPAWDEEPPPVTLDWDAFLGPAPLRPHDSRLWVKEEFQHHSLLWRGWDHYADYSGHLMTNWGAHSVDMAQLALDRDATGPVAIEARPPASLDATARPWLDKTPPPDGTANDRRFWPVTARFADGLVYDFSADREFTTFHGERGRLFMRRNAFTTDPPGLAPGGPDAAVAARWNGSGHVARPHLENWLEGLRSRATPNAPLEAAHRTASICHLANLARQLARPLRWDPLAERFLDDPQADALRDRERRAAWA